MNQDDEMRQGGIGAGTPATLTEMMQNYAASSGEPPNSIFLLVHPGTPGGTAPRTVAGDAAAAAPKPITMDQVDPEHLTIARLPDSHGPAADPIRSLIDGISRGEGTGAAAVAASKGKFGSGYDVTYKNNAYGTPEKPISQMTLDEVRQYQSQMLDQQRAQGVAEPASPVGMAQITRTMLDGLRRNMGLKGSEVFSSDLQDRMAKELLQENGLRDYQTGKINARDFQDRLARQWDTVADPATGKTKHGGRLGMTSQQAQDYISHIPVSGR